MTLETVLLAVGPKDSDRADELAETVVEVAGPSDATVDLVHVFTPSEFDDVIDRLDFDEHTAPDPSEVARRHGTIKDLTGVLDSAGIEYDIRGRKGDHATEIVDHAAEIGADRIVVGGSKRSPSGKAVFGSVAQDIMLDASCPVTFVKGDD
ncbi:universal stress protein [Halorhabdus salina]|uniref:universal stress protein n=1 Tax=Halorhabdus salina TaxID=2750670 RepID=UPI0015EFCF5B|nr:universal stress protein [Halorhabdus salina]